MTSFSADFCLHMMMPSRMFRYKTKLTWDTEYNADAVAWCPFDPALLLLATYHVEASSNANFSKEQRRGRLYLLKIKDCQVEVVQRHECSALLDVQWCPNLINDTILVGTVDADCYLSIYELKEEKLLILNKLRIGDKVDSLALSLDFQVVGSDCQLVVSDSEGNVALVTLDKFGLKLTEMYGKAHEFDAWYVCFDRYDCNLFYSGGDDSRWKVFDTRSNERHVAVNKYHGAGVTSLASMAPNLLYSGSYDEHICAWDLRFPRSNLRERRIEGGGVWRIRGNYSNQISDFNNTNPNNSNDDKWLLLACMHAGFHLLSDADFEPLLSFDEHQSLAYGADIKLCRDKMDCDSRFTLATCSFYDNCLKVWEVSKET